jgi:hypothetical protein
MFRLEPRELDRGIIQDPPTQGWPSRLKAVVEIRPGFDGELPQDLLRTIYSASQDGTVALSLTNVAVAAVNKVLDQIVPLFPLTIPGVRYLRTDNTPLLTWVLDRATGAFGDSDTFRRAAFAAGFSQPLPFSRQFDKGDSRGCLPCDVAPSWIAAAPLRPSAGALFVADRGATL